MQEERRAQSKKRDTCRKHLYFHVSHYKLNGDSAPHGCLLLPVKQTKRKKQRHQPCRRLPCHLNLLAAAKSVPCALTTRWGGGRQHRARHMEYVPAVRQALNLLPDLEVLQSKKRRRKFKTIKDRERRKIRRDLAIHRSA
jgi:hypothetical protein